MKLHRNLGEYWDVLHQDSLVEFERVKLEYVLAQLSLENEKLVLLLFIHDKVFAADNGQSFFILRLLHSNDFIWFSAC
jgi:hypothetical protein